MLVVVAAALMNEQGKVLIQQRPQGKTHAGLWEFPGGKREEGETPEVALQRELYEELGIDVGLHQMQPCHFVTYPFHDYKLLYPAQPHSTMPVLDNQMFLLLLYRVRHWQGKAYSREGQPLLWVDEAEIVHYAMPPADIPLLSYIWEREREAVPQYKVALA